jgi:hypothetical protein
MVSHPSSFNLIFTMQYYQYFLEIGLMELTISLKSILGWERLPLFGRYGYVEMIKCLTKKLFHFAGYIQGISSLY